MDSTPSLSSPKKSLSVASIVFEAIVGSRAKAHPCIYGLSAQQTSFPLRQYPASIIRIVALTISEANRHDSIKSAEDAS